MRFRPKTGSSVYSQYGAEPLLEQRVYEFFRIKGQQIAGFLADSYITHRQSKLTRDGDNNAALGGSVQLRENYAGDSGGVCKQFCLLKAILTGGRVDNQQDFMRGAWNQPLSSP